MKKSIVCFGDSNTHGYCADPADCSSGGARFDETERWTCLLADKLGPDYRVYEEGLSGRTTVFPDYRNMQANMCGADVLKEALWTHEPISLLIIMLGTNDCQAIFNASAYSISFGMNKLIDTAKKCAVWRDEANILIVAPPHIRESVYTGPWAGAWAADAVEKSKALADAFKPIAEMNGCHFLDAADYASFGDADGIHMTKASHKLLANALYEKVKSIV